MGSSVEGEQRPAEGDVEELFAALDEDEGPPGRGEFDGRHGLTGARPVEPVGDEKAEIARILKPEASWDQKREGANGRTHDLERNGLGEADIDVEEPQDKKCLSGLHEPLGQ